MPRCLSDDCNAIGEKVQQHRQLRRRQGELALLCRGPDEPALLQALAEQTSALSIPPNDLDQIAPPAAEDEHVTRERVLLQRLIGLRRHSPPSKPAANQTRVFAGTGIILTGPGSAAPASRDRRSRKSEDGDRPRCQSCSGRASDQQPVPYRRSWLHR